MSGCARRGTKRNRCSDRCPMIGSRLSLAVPTRKIRRRRDQNGLSRSALLRITDSTRTSSYVRKVPTNEPASREGLAARSGDYVCRSNSLNERR